MTVREDILTIRAIRKHLHKPDGELRYSVVDTLNDQIIQTIHRTRRDLKRNDTEMGLDAIKLKHTRLIRSSFDGFIGNAGRGRSRLDIEIGGVHWRNANNPDSETAIRTYGGEIRLPWMWLHNVHAKGIAKSYEGFIALQAEQVNVNMPNIEVYQVTVMHFSLLKHEQQGYMAKIKVDGRAIVFYHCTMLGAVSKARRKLVNLIGKKLG